MPEDEKDKRVRKKLPVMTSTVALGALLGMGYWWAKSTNGFRDFNFLGSPDVKDERTLTPEEIAGRVPGIKERFLAITGITAKQFGRRNFSDEEHNLVQGVLENYECVEEMHTGTGFSGAAYRNKKTGEIVLALGGANITTVRDFILDFDDIVASAGGGKISQWGDAVALASQVKEKYGKIDYVCGYSIGGYLALYLTGSGLCGNAKCFTFDSPGVTRSMVANCADISGSARTEVEARFKSLCTSITAIHNSYNTFGRQPGEHLAFSNAVNWMPYYPTEHGYIDFLQKLSSGKQLQQGSDDGESATVLMTSLLAMGIATAFGRVAWRSFRKNGEITPQEKNTQPTTATAR